MILDNIRRSLGTRASFGNKRPIVRFAPELPEELQVYVPFHRTSHIYRLFLYWEYQLGILAKEMDYRPTRLFVKEELRKLEEITAQVAYLVKTAFKRWTIFFQTVKRFSENGRIDRLAEGVAEQNMQSVIG